MLGQTLTSRDASELHGRGWGGERPPAGGWGGGGRATTTRARTQGSNQGSLTLLLHALVGENNPAHIQGLPEQLLFSQTLKSVSSDSEQQ